MAGGQSRHQHILHPLHSSMTTQLFQSLVVVFETEVYNLEGLGKEILTQFHGEASIVTRNLKKSSCSTIRFTARNLLSKFSTHH